MNVLIVVLVMALGAGLCVLWLWWTNHQVKSEYRARWDSLNRSVGGILPGYDEATRSK